MNGNKFWTWVASWLPNFGEHTIYGKDNKPYLRRIYLTPRRKGKGDKVWWPGIFLHHFYTSDQDRFPHDHPWRGLSLILSGGYTESAYYPYEWGWEEEYFGPGSLNYIDSDKYHLVKLKDPINGAWSLFFAFKRLGNWGFWDTENNQFVPAKTFLGKESDTLEDD